MNGYSFHTVPTLVARDVQAVERDAAFVIDITSGRPILHQNKGYVLQVIAVVGPGEFQGKQYAKALLAEVGLFRSRPYRPTSGKQQFRPRRRTWFSLSDEQYILVAPLLFMLMQALVNERVPQWTTRTFTLTVTQDWYVRSHRAVYERTRRETYERGLYFSVHRKDSQLCADLFATELKSPSTQKRLRGFSRSINMLIGHYARSTVARKRFWKLQGAREVERRLEGSKLPFYLIVAMFYRSFGTRSRLWYRLGDPIGWDPTIHDDPWELELARKALPGRDERIQGIQFRTVRQFRDRGITVIELYASPGVYGTKEREEAMSARID